MMILWDFWLELAGFPGCGSPAPLTADKSDLF